MKKRRVDHVEKKKSKVTNDDNEYAVDYELTTDKSEDRNISIARIHPDVHTLNIDCFTHQEEPRGDSPGPSVVCQETSTRIPSFLTLFSSLQEVRLLGR